MVKKSARRSWALTAAFALLASIFGAAPAQAAGEVTIGVAKGDVYAVTTTDTFKLNVALGVGTNNAFAQQVKIKVANSAGATLSWTVSGTGSASYYEGTSTSHVAAGQMDATTAGSVEIAMSASSSVSATTSVVVTAWVDADNDSVVDAGEWSADRTVTFIPYSGVTGTATFDALSEGEAAQDYTVTTAFTNVNIHEMDDTITAYFSVSNVASGSKAVTVTTGVATTSGTVSAAATFSADITYNGVKLLTSNTVASGDRTVDAVSVSAVKGANIKMSESGKATARANSTFTLQMLTTTSSSDLVGVATSGTYEVSTTETLGTGVTLTVGGVTHTTTSTLPTKSAFTTDASGKATLTLTTVGFSTSKTVTVKITVQNTTSQVVISQQAAAFTTTNTDGDYAWSLKGGSLTLNYGVKDQWGEAPSGVTQRIKVAFTGTNLDVDTAYGTVAAGVASVTVTANPATFSGDITATSTLEKQDSNGYWAADSAATNDSAVTWKVSADAPKFTTGNEPASDSASISGATATISATANLAGAVVTVTGAGLTFTAADGTTTSDSLVYRTGNAGAVSIPVTSKVAGKYPVTVQIGTWSHDIVITIDDIDAAAATKMTIEQVGGGSYVAPGSTLRVKITLTDANGNLAKSSGASLSVTVTGPGFVGTLPTKTDKNGEATLNVLLGSQDTGTVKVEGSFAGTKTVTSSAEFTVGTAPAAEVEKKITVGSFKGFIAIYTKGYEGSKLSAKVAGKWLVEPSLSNWNGKDYSRTVRFTGAGYLIQVHLYIDGEFVRTDEVTTK